MSTRHFACVILGFALALSACEKRDLGQTDATDESTASDQAEADTSSADEEEADEQPDEKADSPADDKGEAPDEAGDDAESTGTEDPSDAPRLAGWDTCTDGARRALRCDFAEGGGVALCTADAFVELRVARPDGARTIHRHPAGGSPSVEQCRYTSPQRTDSSLTFYEIGQRLMVESHNVNPERDDDGAAGKSEWSLTIAQSSGSPQTWPCEGVEHEESAMPSDHPAVALRPSGSATCNEVEEASLAIARRGAHQDRSGEASCGGDEASAEFVGQAASGEVARMAFTAQNKESDRQKRARFTEVTLASNDRDWTEPIASCRSFFERVRANSDPSTLGRAPYQIEVGFGYLSYAGHRIFDVARDVCTDFCEDESAFAGDFITSSVEGLSLVGPVLSYRRDTSEAAAGGPPYHGESWGAVDIRTMQQARFDALVETDSILTALKHDSYVRRHSELSKAISEADSLDAALAALRKRVDGADAYSFHYYNARKNVVAMRIPFRESTAGLSPNRMSQIGLWVTPKEEWIPAFKAARDAPEGGFYMTNYDLTF